MLKWTIYITDIIYNSSIHIFNINYYIAYILRYKYKLLTLEACNLQHSTNIDLSLDTVLVYDCRLQNAILTT